MKYRITPQRLLFWAGTASLVVAGIVLLVSLWDAFFRMGSKAQVLEVPGFHVLDLDTPGVYAGIYQHAGPGAIPIERLSKLSVHVISKDTYEEIPVLMNSTGQTVSRLGFQGMVVFNFIVDKPGFYTLSALAPDTSDSGPLSLLLLPQAMDPRSPLLAGVFFTLVFVGLGVWALLKSRRPTIAPPTTKN